jgi:uncharacterized protein
MRWSTCWKTREKPSPPSASGTPWRMYVFGSALRDDFRPGESDIDLLVEFAPLEPHEKAKAFFALLDGLKELLGSNVDLVAAGAIRNRYIAREVDRTKQMLYAA